LLLLVLILSDLCRLCRADQWDVQRIVQMIVAELVSAEASQCCFVVLLCDFMSLSDGLARTATPEVFGLV
jgi:hypothetical protein